MSENKDAGYDWVLVPVGDKSDPNKLTQLSSILVDPRHGHVQFTHVTTEQSFVRSQEDWRTASDAVTECQHILRDQGIDSSGSIRSSASAVEGILEEAEEQDSDAILIGWTDKESVSRFVVQLLRQADCDVIVFSGKEEPRDTDSILVPIIAPPGENRLQMLAIMSQRTDATVTFTYIVSGQGNTQEGRDRLEQSAEGLAEYGVQAKTELTESDDVVQKLGELSADYDMMVIGTSREWWLYQTLFGRKTDKIRRAAQCSVLMHKWSGEIPPDE